MKGLTLILKGEAARTSTRRRHKNKQRKNCCFPAMVSTFTQINPRENPNIKIQMEKCNWKSQQKAPRNEDEFVVDGRLVGEDDATFTRDISKIRFSLPAFIYASARACGEGEKGECAQSPLLRAHLCLKFTILP